MSNRDQMSARQQEAARTALLPLLSWLPYPFLTVGALITHACVALKAGSISLLIVGIVQFPLGTIIGWLTWFEWLVYTF